MGGSVWREVRANVGFVLLDVSGKAANRFIVGERHVVV